MGLLEWTDETTPTALFYGVKVGGHTLRENLGLPHKTTNRANCFIKALLPSQT